MKLSTIINELRLHVALFEHRVGGAAEFSTIPDVGKLALPAAYVIPLDDRAGDNKSQTDYWQDVTEGFGVVVVLSNKDERGQDAAYDVVEDVKVALWRALLGFEVSNCHAPIQYDGGDLLEIDRVRLFYQFNFSAKREVNAEDTRQFQDLNDDTQVGRFDSLGVNVNNTLRAEVNHIYEGKTDKR